MHIKDFIFSKQYCGKHIVLKIFGIKFKFQTKEYKNFDKVYNFKKYKDKNIDITQLPKASGVLRDIQLANLALLQDFDYVCKQNNLKYWLDSGTLLGAVRHKGFIPWDDDIDLSMMREDYNKIIEAFEKSARNKDIYAEYVTSDDSYACFIKIKHKKCEHLFLDIFPCDYYGKHIVDENEKNLIINKLKNAAKALNVSKNYSLNINERLEVINRYTKEILCENNISEDSDIACGLDFPHCDRNWFWTKDVIFPLKTIEFEGMELACMNKPEIWLEKVYGNYMSYPQSNSMPVHNSFKNFSEQDKEVIKQLVESVNIK